MSRSRLAILRLLHRSSLPVGRSTNGFALIEVLLGTILIGLVLSGAFSAQVVANRASGRHGGLSRLEALIDQDFAAIQTLDRRFSCCAGSCTATAATIAAATTCRNSAGNPVNPGDENYYSPRQGSTITTTAEMTNFESACRNGNLASTFQALLPTPPVPEAPAGLSRNVLIADSVANRLQIAYSGTYQGSTVVTRVVNLIPTVAAWCP